MRILYHPGYKLTTLGGAGTNVVNLMDNDRSYGINT